MKPITNKEIQTLDPSERLETLIKLIDTPIGRRNLRDVILLAQELHRDLISLRSYEMITPKGVLVKYLSDYKPQSSIRSNISHKHEKETNHRDIKE